MSTTAFGSSGSRSQNPLSSPIKLVSPTMTHDNLADRRITTANEGMTTTTTLQIRNLPRNTKNADVRTMLLFAKDLQDTEIVPIDHQEDSGFVTAVARFSSANSAAEVQAMLHGKPNTAGQTKMVVEIIHSPGTVHAGRRNTIDPTATRSIGQSLSPPPSQMPKSSRFNGTFQTMGKLSPPLAGSQPDHISPESNAHLQTIFSPQSPVGNSMQDQTRISGKTVIDEETGDDETGELLKDPLAYMNSDGSALHPGPRSAQMPRLPISALNALSITTNMNATTQNPYTSPRSAVPSQISNSSFSPNGHPYQMSNNQYLRHNYPPVNPADQNPPCNTLYVGNLPMDTSEDELKAMFSKQRGYKRLCFRTKQNGPMCFVEFEDISFATKALNELYGVQLHNSVKGGIRLSFSKNPLGVRSGQPGSNNPSTPLSAATPGMNGFSPMSPTGFSTANGPPPGLSAPPGLNMAGSMSPPLPNSQFTTQPFPLGSSALHGSRMMPMGSSLGSNHANGIYPDYMMGR